MPTAVTKLKLLFIPFLLIAISFLVLYTFLNWLLIIHLQLFSVKEIIVNFGIPFALPWIPVLIWFRPRIKLLNLKTEKNDLSFLYQFIVVLGIAVPTIIAQSYIETAAGKLTELNDIKEINNQELTKYYTLKNYYIDRLNIGAHTSFEVSGKHDEDFNMHLYCTLPILSSESDTTYSDCLAWYCIEYSKQISNRLDEKEKEEEYQKFADESQLDFDKKDVTQFVYFDHIGNTDDYEGYVEAAKQSKKYGNNGIIALLPINTPFEERNGTTFNWIFISLSIGAIIWLVLILSASIDTNELEMFKRGKALPDNEMQEFVEMLKPREGYFITPILIYLNLGIFLIMMFAGLGFISFKSQDLLNWGANYRPATVNGEWWRLLTSTFLHGGLMHLVCNMYGLLFVGVFLEPLLGKTRYLIVYLLTGIIASSASLWWYDATVSVGASGAIFGLYGLFLALLLTKVFPPDFGKAFMASTLVFIGFNLLMGLTGGIDNAAHIGGLLSGFVIGLILYPTLKKQAITTQNDM